MKKYKIVFLVPVFEKEDCVEDLVLNIQHFCPNSAVVLHVNSKTPDIFYNNIHRISNYYDHCYVAPFRYPTDWCSGHLTKAYIDVMKWCNENLFYDYVYLTASNSLVINANLETDINKYPIFSWEPWPTNSSNGWWQHIEKDTKLFKYTDPVFCCAFEGSAYNRHYCGRMVDELYDLLNYEPFPYPTEEYWLPSALVKVINRFSVDYSKYSMERWVHLKDGTTHDLALNIDSVEEYICDFIFRKDYDFLSDIKVYSLKRVPRVYDAPLRVMIRENYNYTNKLF